MTAARPLLVYRDRLGVPSEIGFLRRQYVGFQRLRPVWLGRTVLADAALLGSPILPLGGAGPLGPPRRAVFRYLGWAPRIGIDDPVAVLHAQFARGGALALPLARAMALRMAVTLHGGDVSKRRNWRHTVLARRWPALVRYASCFVCVSSAVAEIAAARGVPEGKLSVLPIGVTLPDTPPAIDPRFHLFVGRFVEKKGIGVLADAIRRLRAMGDPTPLVCVGDGPLRPALEALARDVQGVVLTGWLDGAAVRARMREAVSLVVPSIVAASGDTEGLPSVIPEAMAMACPVIGSDQGGIAEALRTEQTGLLVPPGDAQALAAAMRRVAADSALRGRLGTAGFAYAQAALNARLQSAKLEALLLGLAEAPHGECR